MRAFVAIALLCATAHAETHVIRIATVAPQGSSWAHEIELFGRAVENRSHGSVRLKFYFDAKAGNELEVKQRIERGQLDGTGSGGMMCNEVAPSMKVLRLTGLFQTAGEASYVVGRLTPRFEKEAEARGYTLLALASLGGSTIFSRKPVKSIDQLRKVKLWRWESDEIGNAIATSMGFDVVPLPLEKAARAFDDGKVEAFYSIPTAALAFQFYVQAPYILSLTGDFLYGCLVVRSGVLDELGDSEREIIQSESAKFAMRLAELTRRQDAELLDGGIFGRQGGKLLAVSSKFRADFNQATRQAREQLDDRLVAKTLIKEVVTMLAEYRGERR